MTGGGAPRVALGLVGAGQVGRAFLGQILAQREALAATGRMSLEVVAVARSRQMVLTKGTDGDATGALDLDLELDLDALAQHVRAQAAAMGGIAVLVDSTASASLPDAYAAWLESGIHIITPNKQAGAGPLERWDAIQDAAQRGGTRFRGEATVGAGLPVLSTLRSLRETGDEILSIEGVLSGSLAYLLDAWSRGEAFSEGLRKAAALGYLEPDPREDLSGRDVVRKMVILARGAGHRLEASAATVQGLVPDILTTGSVEDFWQHMDVLDAGVEQILTGVREGSASVDRCVIRFVGSLSRDGTVAVGPRALPLSHPFAGLSGTGNAIAFTTRRYNETPLMIQGPGAGPDVTASGMFSDLLEVVAAARTS
jgi:homoserine dehydrogenase